MIVKFFPHGNTSQGKTGRTSGGNAVRDYLLGKDSEREKATLIRGNADQTTEIINGITNKSIYTSGVLSFAESEKPTEKELEEIINSFESTMFPNMDKDQYSGYWVKHGDKDRTELHFVFANVELKTGKALPVYYHRNDKNLVDSWKNLTNDKYKLLDPNAPNQRKQLTPTTRNEKDNAQKCGIHDRILSAVEQDKTVNSREDVIKTIEKVGYEVTRASKKDDTISIKNPQGERNLKLKGELYSPNFSRDKLPNKQEYAQNVYDSNRDKRIAEQKTKYESHLTSRENRLNKRFGDIDRTPINNQLTKDLEQIRAENEPVFHKTVLNDKEVTAVTELKSQEQPKPQEQVKNSFAERMAEIRARNALKTPEQHQAERQARDERVEKVWQEFKQAEQIAQQISTQQAKMGELSKGEVTPATYETLQKYTPSKLEQTKAEHEQRVEKLADKAQHEPLTPNELKEYAFSRRLLTSIDRLEQERAIAQAERLRLEQERQAQEKNNKKQSELTAVSKPKPQSQPAVKPPSEYLEPRLTSKATQAPPPPSREQVQAQRNDQIKQALQTISSFEKLVSDKAQVLKNDTIKSRTQTASKANKELSDHLADKPVLKIWKMGDWETKKTELEKSKRSADLLLAQAKGNIEKLKNTNLEPIDYTAHALERLDKDPATKAQHEASDKAHILAQQILEELANEKAQEHGADFHAQQGVRYSGKILRADEKGVLQDTQKGIVYYSQKLDVKQDKGYNITLKGDHYQIQDQMEIRQQNKEPSQEQHKGKGR